MNYWLLKTEPSDYSFDDLENEPAGTVWDGVRNYAALKHLRDMRRGDRAIVYHTGGVRAAVGVAEVTSDAYPDPRADDPKLAVVDIAAARRLERPVPLAELRGEDVFAGSELLRQARLSVLPLDERQWRHLTGE